MRSKNQIINDLIYKEHYKDLKKSFNMYISLNKHGIISDEELNNYLLSEKSFGLIIKDPTRWKL